MKLLRSKRVGPQRRPGGFSSVPVAGRCLRLPDPRGRRRWWLSPVPGALLPGGALTTGWVGSLNSPVGRWPAVSPFFGVGPELTADRALGQVPPDRGSRYASAPLREGRGRRARLQCGIGRDCSQCRSPVPVVRRPGRVHERTLEVGEEGRSPTRPVLKHGPRSLTRTRVAGLCRSPWA